MSTSTSTSLPHQHPLFNATYAVFRVSPLHHGDSTLLDPTPLRIHAVRLRDLLRGDTLRGVAVGPDGDATITNSSSGKLEDCTWDLLDEEALWLDPYASSSSSRKRNGASAIRDDRRMIPPESACAIHIRLRYERASHTALFLRNLPAGDGETPGFTSFPLLLVRIPQPARQTVLDHLSRTFDAHIAPLLLSSHFLTHTLDALLTRMTPDDADPATAAALLKSLQLQLSTPSVTPHLKTLDVGIPATDIPGFLSRGRDIASSANDAFTAALDAHLRAHLALTRPVFSISGKDGKDDSGEESPFQLTRLACAPLALAREGRLKLVPPPPPPAKASSGESAAVREACGAALKEAIGNLVREAAGSQGLGGE